MTIQCYRPKSPERKRRRTPWPGCHAAWNEMGFDPVRHRNRCRSSGGKVRYRNEAAAHEGIAAARRGATIHEGRKLPVRVYECDDCWGWHLTSKPLNPVPINLREIAQ